MDLVGHGLHQERGGVVHLVRFQFLYNTIESLEPDIFPLKISVKVPIKV
jgi:hypothetical protein